MYAFEEGSIIFPQEPIVRIHANLIEAQIVEALILNIINFQSLIATKTARVWLASKKGGVMEFGDEARRFKCGDVTLVGSDVVHTTYSDPGTASKSSYIFIDLF